MVVLDTSLRAEKQYVYMLVVSEKFLKEKC